MCARLILLPSALALLLLTACARQQSPPTEATSAVETAPPQPLDLSIEQGPIALPAYEIEASQLLAATLTPDQLQDGWVRLWDGHTLFGWSIVGQADWQCRDGVLRVTRGEKSFLYTNFEIADCELLVDFRAAPQANSGIFVRTIPEPRDVTFDCIEVNIAPPDNPFPTGSLVGRQRVEPEQLGDFDPSQWHTYRIRLDGPRVTVHLDDQLLVELTDDTTSRRGHISLQFNEGVVEFRNLLMRPLDARPLKLDEDWQSDWTVGEKEPGVLSVTPTANGLHIQGGLGKVETQNTFGDFVLQTSYTLARSEVNSGIFFRCVADSMLDGYEYQINHAVLNNDPLTPADAGAGAIFRRQPARIVVGDGLQPTYLTLLASGLQMVTWVNGLMTADYHDDRPADPNPRRGSRLQPGTIALQGHDPTTDLVIHRLQITELR